MKREDMEKELDNMGKAPKGIKDIFHQCRGFEKAFTIAVDVRCPPMKPLTLNLGSSMTATHPSRCLPAEHPVLEEVGTPAETGAAAMGAPTYAACRNSRICYNPIIHSCSRFKHRRKAVPQIAAGKRCLMEAWMHQW